MRLIDADALINDILTDYGCDPKYIADETIDGLKPYTDNLILERIGLQPTIDAVPVVHGEWTIGDAKLYHCSICGKTAPYDVSADVIEYWRDLNYCTNCGADMRKGEHDEQADS